MQIRVRPKDMLLIAEDMVDIKRRMGACESELAQVRKNLAGLSGFEDQIAQIQQCGDGIEREAQYCILFSNILINVCRIYETNEMNLINYGEQVKRMARQESFENQNLDELREKFNRIIL